VTSLYEDIRSGMKRGTLAECFQLPDVRCISGLQPDVWFIQGRKSILAFMDLAKRIHNDKKINGNYTIAQVQQVLDRLILENIENPGITQEAIIRKARDLLPTSGAQNFEVTRGIFGVKASKYREISPFVFQKADNAYRRFFSGKGKGWGSFRQFRSDYVIRYKPRFSMENLKRHFPDLLAFSKWSSSHA